jgi:hypothetical protein
MTISSFVKDMKVNIQIIQWLLKNKDVLLQVVGIAKTWKKDLPYIQQWELVDKIARLVVPVIEAELSQPHTMSAVDAEVATLAAGAELNALGIDYQTLIETVIPIIVAILQALVAQKTT